MTCLVQVWTIGRAVVPAQDCVRYLVVAQAIERDGLFSTLRSQPEQPLFPAMAWLAHRLLTGAGCIAPSNWAICLQLAAALPLVLAVVPVHALFCRLHGDQAAVIGTLMYCLLGGIARLAADGLSDSTHLCLFCLALWAAAHYFPALIAACPPESEGFGSPLWLFLCSGFTGLALTARSEALVLPLAVPATLALLQGFSGSRRPWSAVAQAAGAYVLGLAAVLAPYLALSDAATPTTALARLTGRRGALEAAPLNHFEPGIEPTALEPHWNLPGTGRLVFGKKDFSMSTRFHGFAAAAAKLMRELAQTLHYWIGALALVGLWTARRRKAAPLDRFMQCVCATLIAAALGVASQAGYLSSRHVLLFVVLGVGWAGVGTLAIGNWLRRAWNRQLERTLGRAMTPVVACMAIVACGADCWSPLHTSRTAHRDAARWLSEHAGQSDAVLDSRGWTALYTGRKTYRYEAAQAAFTDPALSYVVVEQAELESLSRRSETLRLLMAQAGEEVVRLAAGSEKHGVVIHRWRPESFQQLGVENYAR